VIGEQLDSCRSMVVVWSRASVKKEWVRQEAESATAQMSLPQLLAETAIGVDCK
jgi:hypothetical protein